MYQSIYENRSCWEMRKWEKHLVITPHFLSLSQKHIILGNRCWYQYASWTQFWHTVRWNQSIVLW